MITPQAFESYLQIERSAHIRFATRLTRNSEDAEDVLQDATIRAFRGLHALHSEDVNDAWFRQIVKNCFLDSIRRKNRRAHTTSLEGMQMLNPVFDVADPASTPKKISEWEEECSTVLLDALANLPSEQRKLVLGHLNGLTCKELSSGLNCGVVTVRTKLQNALRKIRRNLLTSQFSKSFPEVVRRFAPITDM